VTDARRDSNYVPTLSGVQLDDLTTPTPLVVDHATGRLLTASALPSGAATSAKQLADNHQVTVSNIASTPVISGFATESGGNLDTISSDTTSIDGKITECDTDSVTIVGGVQTDALTDDELRNTPVPVSGSFYQATQPISAAALPLPDGAATSAKQDELISLIETLQELNQRLIPLASAMNAGAVSLRVTGVSMPSTAVTSSTFLTSAGMISGFSTTKQSWETLTVTMANINNCVGE